MARNLTAQRNARSELTSCLTTAVRIYGPCRQMCRHDEDAFAQSTLHPVVAAKVIGLAFLSAVTSWEDFVSSAFLGYLCGYRAPSGYAPRLRTGPAANRNHALQIITGETHLRDAERKCRWNSFKWVQSVASIHFRSGDPFTRMPQAVVTHLEYATTIRNRVAHSSEKARAQFKDVSNQLLRRQRGTALPRGFSPGQLLISNAHDTFPSSELDAGPDLGVMIQTWGDVFESYMSLFLEQSLKIVPGE